MAGSEDVAATVAVAEDELAMLMLADIARVEKNVDQSNPATRIEIEFCSHSLALVARAKEVAGYSYLHDLQAMLGKYGVGGRLDEAQSDAGRHRLTFKIGNAKPPTPQGANMPIWGPRGMRLLWPNREAECKRHPAQSSLVFRSDFTMSVIADASDLRAEADLRAIWNAIAAKRIPADYVALAASPRKPHSLTFHLQ